MISQSFVTKVLSRTQNGPNGRVIDLQDQADFRNQWYRGCGSGFLEFDPEGRIVHAGYCEGLEVENELGHQSVNCTPQPAGDGPFLYRQQENGNIRIAVNFSCWQACLF